MDELGFNMAKEVNARAHVHSASDYIQHIREAGRQRRRRRIDVVAQRNREVGNRDSLVDASACVSGPSSHRSHSVDRKRRVLAHADDPPEVLVVVPKK